jgi:hypothetical protein
VLAHLSSALAAKAKAAKGSQRCDAPSFVVASGEFDECGSQLFDRIEGSPLAYLCVVERWLLHRAGFGQDPTVVPAARCADVLRP